MIALPILCAVVLRIGWSFAGLYGQDAHDYLHQAQAWHAWFLGGARPEGSLHPQLYPLLGGAIGLVTGDLMALRILSLGALIGVVMIVRSELLARDADRRVVDMYMIISLVASPFLLRQAMFAMSDLLCLFFIMLAYRMAVRFGDDGKNRRTFGVALCAGAALAVRFAAAPLAIAIGIHVLVSTIRQRAWKAALAGLAGKAVLAVAILVVLGKAGTRALHHPWIENWSVLNFFQRSFDTLDGTADYRWPNIVHAFFPIGHPGFLLMGVPLLFFFHREDLKARGARLAILMFALYACFIAGVPYQNDRFQLLGQPVVAILFFPAVTRAWAFMVKWPAIRVALVCAFLFAQLALFTYGMRTFVKLARIERELAMAIGRYPDRAVYQFSLGPALQTYKVEVPIIDLWDGRIQSFDPHALLLFNPSAFAKQWRGKDPMLNYEAAMALHPQLIERRDDGWELYQMP